MTELISIIDRLHRNRTLRPDEYRQLLLTADDEAVEFLHGTARSVADTVFGKKIYVRALLEISNICRNDCLYCGIRRSNSNVRRYFLSDSEIIRCCSRAYTAGFRTFVLQGGEMPEEQADRITGLCREIYALFPDCAITLSLGEYSHDTYRRFREAGASRYLLRHETADAEHYARLHPQDMSLNHRLCCLLSLKRLGFQTGTGIMTGSPYQTPDNIIKDILYIGALRPEMIGLGPFIPHRDTQFAGWWDEGEGIVPGLNRKESAMELAVRLISVFRLMFPDALIPATTALATISPDGRKRGILAGANVVMPNISPGYAKGSYSLYDGKVSEGAESSDGIVALEGELNGIGYGISWERGDYGKN